MKQYIITALACLSLISCENKKQGFEIEGEIQGATSGKVYLQEFRNKMFFTVDSTEMKEGKFEFKGVVEIPAMYGIITEDMKYPTPFFVENKSFDMELSEKGKIIAVENSPVNDLYLANEKLVHQNNFDIDTLVANNPNSTVAAFYLYRFFTYRLPLEQVKALRAKFTAEVQQSDYIKQLDQIIATLEKVQIGKVAPNFTLPDVDGKEVSLNDFRGQYVFIDFWASWCPPCRKENPNVVAAYEKFKGKDLTFIGISLDKSKAAWLKAIEADQLNWVNVSDLKFWDAEVAAMYGVRSIPSNVLISPEGVIIAKNLKGEALHTKLAELLK